MIDTLYDSPLAVDGTYVAPTSGAPSVPVRVIRRTESSEIAIGLSGAVRPANAFDVRVSEVPAPIEGATLSVGSETFTVTSWKPDEEALVWQLDMDPKP